MDLRGPAPGFFALLLLASASLCAQVPVSGRVIDENGAAIQGARVELRTEDSRLAVVASSDAAGNFRLVLPAAGEYAIRAERLGFYLYQNRSQTIQPGSTELNITLNHLQEFSERIDVTYSPPAIDPQQPADRKELDNTEIQNVPYPAPQDYRNALPLIDGVVQDNLGRAHFNGGQTHQTSYTLDGFNISDPVTGRLETRVNIETIQSMEVQSSRFSAENGRGSAGTLDLKTKMGDDRWRFGGHQFHSRAFRPRAESTSTNGRPRVEFSGPLAKGRAWFHNGFDAFYSNDLVHGLPMGENRTSGLTTSDLTRFQVNLTRGNILTASFLYNLADTRRLGLSFVNPTESTTNRRQATYMSSLRDQAYFGNGALLDLGFADTRANLRDAPLGRPALRNHAFWQSRQLFREPGPPLLSPAGNREPVSADAAQARIASPEVRHRRGARGVSPGSVAARLRGSARRQFAGSLCDL